MGDIEATIVQQPVKAEVVQQSVTATIPSAVIIENAIIQYLWLSAYELAVQEWFEGTLEEWLESIQWIPGSNIELQKLATHIQWRVVWSPTWTNLVALSEIKWDPGTTTWAWITDKPSTFTPSVHWHAISDITGLISALAWKSPIWHTHEISDINSLRDELDTKSNIAHTHDYNTLDNLPNIPDVIIHADEVNFGFSGTEISILYDPVSPVQVYRNGQLLTEWIDRTIFGRDITFEYAMTDDIITLSYYHI